MEPRISIITVCYNNIAGLQRTMSSVASQVYANKEFIIIDGGSTDGTQAMVKNSSTQPDIFISEKDNGIYDAMNKGIGKASGEWLIFMNSGDIFADNMVLADIFEKGVPKGKDFIYSDSLFLKEDGKMILRTMDRKRGDVHHQNAIYRKSLHSQYGYYIVTHPYIVSDMMFFLAIPEEKFYKTDINIAISDDGGISCEMWCTEQAWALKVVYGMETIPMIFFRLMRMKFGKWRKSLFSGK